MIPNLYTKNKIADSPLRMLPNVFITMPFEPLITPKSSLETKLKKVLYNVERELYTSFPETIADGILQKLKSVIAGLDYASHRKSIAIYISSFVEKAYFLNSIVTEEVVVGKPLSFSDIVHNKKEEKKYLLLVLSSESTRIFAGEPGKLTLKVLNLPEQVAKYTGYSFNENDSEEIGLKRFVKHADDVLSLLLKWYDLPLIVMTTPKARKQFLQLSKNKEQVSAFINIESGDITEEEILTAIQPFIEDWENLREKHLLHQMEQAIYNRKLVAGIDEVWKTAKHSKSKLLLIERNYRCPAYFEESKEVPTTMKNILPHDSIQLKDAVEDAIENVLKDDGEVEFVEEGVLNDFLHIALIKY